MVKTALVTGGAGFIGHYVSKELANRGIRVIGAGRGTLDDDKMCSAGIARWVEGNISSQLLMSVDEDISEIYHCAGSGSVALSISNPGADFVSNVQTTHEVLEFARTRPGTKVVLASSAGVYGAVKTLPIRVDAELAPVSPYGVNKKISEILCRQYSDHFGVDVALVRLFSVYGEGLRKQLLWDACHKLTRGERSFFGTGNETRDWVHVTDAASLMVDAAGQLEGTQVINGANGVAVRIRDIIEKLAQFLGVTGEVGVPGQSRPGDPVHYQAEITESRSLGWAPKVRLNDGLARYVEWFNADLNRKPVTSAKSDRI